VRELFTRLRNAFDDLSARERILLIAVGVLTIGVVIYFGVVQTSLSLRGEAEERLTTAEQQLRAMTRLRREYDDVHQRLASVERRIETGQRGNLRTTLESLARASLVKVESMEPQATPSNDRYRETKVEVGLKEVTLAQTVNYLQQIESAAQVLSIKTLRMRTRKDKPSFLDVTFTVSAFEPL
jgi:type II secretory pathway component PulM